MQGFAASAACRLALLLFQTAQTCVRRLRSIAHFARGVVLALPHASSDALVPKTQQLNPTNKRQSCTAPFNSDGRARDAGPAANQTDTFDLGRRNGPGLFGPIGTDHRTMAPPAKAVYGDLWHAVAWHPEGWMHMSVRSGHSMSLFALQAEASSGRRGFPACSGAGMVRSDTSDTPPCNTFLQLTHTKWVHIL